MKRLFAALCVLLLTACASPPPAPEPESVAPMASIPTPPPPVERIRSQPLKHLLGRHLKPIPDRELEVRTRCSFRDVGGGQGKMDLQVKKAEVKRFVAEVTIPKQGQCRFDMKTFAQTGRMPNVVLTDLIDPAR